MYQAASPVLTTEAARSTLALEAAEVLAVAAPGGDGTPHGIEETREQTRPLDGCDVQARP